MTRTRSEDQPDGLVDEIVDVASSMVGAAVEVDRAAREVTVDGLRGPLADANYAYPRLMPPAWHQARRVGLSLIFLPFVLIVGVAEIVGLMLSRVSGKRPGEQLPPVSRFRRPDSMPAEAGRRSVADVLRGLRAIPYRPLPLPAQASFYREMGPDGIGFLMSANHSVVTLPHMYPRAFRPRLFDGHDGVKLAGLLAMHRTPSPALIICHGLLTTKNFDYVRRLAVRAYARWGFHVAVVDMRNFGQSAWTTDAPSTAGYLEGRDVVEIARSLRADSRVTSVGTIGYSLGGSAALNAARHASLEDDDPLSGGVIAVSPPADVAEATEYISQRPSWRHPFFFMWLLFRSGMRKGARELGLAPPINDFRELVHNTSLPYYGIEDDEFFHRASALHFAGDITVPTLVMHARDDFIVPVHHAEALRQASDGNDNLAVWIVDRGSHCSLAAVDDRWFHSVLRRWFEYWAQDPAAAHSA